MSVLCPQVTVKILGISDILRMQILEIYTLTLPSIFLSIALLALEYTLNKSNAAKAAI